jgi:hypothetical protein
VPSEGVPLRRSSWASATGNRALVRTLLSRKADVNERYDRDRTALQVAAAEGHTGVVKELLARGANVNAKDSSGLTALHLASGGAIRPSSACCLPTMRMSMGGAEDGTTPLLVASLQERQLRVARQLLVLRRRGPGRGCGTSSSRSRGDESAAGSSQEAARRPIDRQAPGSAEIGVARRRRVRRRGSRLFSTGPPATSPPTQSTKDG